MAQQESSWSALRAGLFVFIALLILGVAIMAVGQRGGVFSADYTLTARFNRIQGLKPAAPVWLAGVDVGTVGEIHFVEADGVPMVDVTLNIQRQFQERIKNDSVASIGSKGLVGDKLVEISLGSPSAPPLQAGDMIRSTQPADLNALMEEGTSMVRDLGDVVRSLKNVTRSIDEGEGSLGKFVNDRSMYENLETVSRELAVFANKLNEGKGSLARFANDDRLYEEATALLRDVRTGSGTLAKLVNDPALYERIESTTTKADAAMARLDNLMKGVENGEGSAGKILTDEELHANVNTTIAELQALIADIKANPRKYINLTIF